ncbi:hypothetical protein M231_01666 [Tremella mesenterica]|uniref:Uncharacterized protein n=1 Tax=Tremella mesenterica TaxID=5217 RepID=A0A4Q1BSL9_TREME|nr:hypothetical protein M231_01666 [Tremella mesenterica]
MSTFTPDVSVQKLRQGQPLTSLTSIQLIPLDHERQQIHLAASHMVSVVEWKKDIWETIVSNGQNWWACENDELRRAMYKWRPWPAWEADYCITREIIYDSLPSPLRQATFVQSLLGPNSTVMYDLKLVIQALGDFINACKCGVLVRAVKDMNVETWSRRTLEKVIDTRTGAGWVEGDDEIRRFTYREPQSEHDLSQWVIEYRCVCRTIMRCLPDEVANVKEVQEYLGVDSTVMHDLKRAITALQRLLGELKSW